MTTSKPTGQPKEPAHRTPWIFWKTREPVLGKRRREYLLRSLARTACYGVVRGIATTAGGLLVTGTLWWIQHQ